MRMFVGDLSGREFEEVARRVTALFGGFGFKVVGGNVFLVV